MTIQDKLNSLNEKSIWYFAKQETDFDKVYKAVALLDKYSGQSISNIFSEYAERENVSSNYRILSVAQLFGLLTKSSPFQRRSSYDEEKLTPVFYSLRDAGFKSIAYEAIKLEQLLKVRMRAVTDSTDNITEFEIYPLLYSCEVLWELHKKGFDSISIDAFLTYVMTSKNNSELEDTVNFLSTPSPQISQYVEQYKDNSRVLTIFQKNTSLLKITNTTISLNLEYSDFFHELFDGGYKCIVNVLNSVINDIPVYQKIQTQYLGIDPFFVDNRKALEEKPHTYSTTLNKEDFMQEYDKYITALKTKPFLLLAGISGTGKSRKVQELAYATCPRDGVLDADPTSPGNYCLIEVKPNWHDSTELLGYYSNISGKYMLTNFIRFVYKATQYPDVPFFVCLDEMNLAPVEQYFAEYLSVLETRKRIKTNGSDKYEIRSAELISKESFANIKLYTSGSESAFSVDDGGEISPKQLYDSDDAKVVQYIKDNGLRLPQNLFVIGTVNMDDTTHQFSRKVIDRAFTIEMNGGNLESMFDAKDTLSYVLTPLPGEMIIPQFTKAQEVLDAYPKEADDIKELVPTLLNHINGDGIFKNTPFRVSYRVENELVLYYAALRELNPDNTNTKDLIEEAFLTILLEKVLPRVEGDEKALNCGTNGSSTILNKLQTYVDNFKPKEYNEGDDCTYNVITQKLHEMNERVKVSYFTSFFS